MGLLHHRHSRVRSIHPHSNPYQSELLSLDSSSSSSLSLASCPCPKTCTSRTWQRDFPPPHFRQSLPSAGHLSGAYLFPHKSQSCRLVSVCVSVTAVYQFSLWLFALHQQRLLRCHCKKSCGVNFVLLDAEQMLTAFSKVFCFFSKSVCLVMHSYYLSFYHGISQCTKVTGLTPETQVCHT